MYKAAPRTGHSMLYYRIYYQRRRCNTKGKILPDDAMHEKMMPLLAIRRKYLDASPPTRLALPVPFYHDTRLLILISLGPRGSLDAMPDAMLLLLKDEFSINTLHDDDISPTSRYFQYTYALCLSNFFHLFDS